MDDLKRLITHRRLVEASAEMLTIINDITDNEEMENLIDRHFSITIQLMKVLGIDSSQSFSELIKDANNLAHANKLEL